MRGAFVCMCECMGAGCLSVLRPIDRVGASSFSSSSHRHPVRSSPSSHVQPYAPAPINPHTHMKPAPPVMRMFLGVYSCCWLAMALVCLACGGV
jgi:hypothetical protein